MTGKIYINQININININIIGIAIDCRIDNRLSASLAPTDEAVSRIKILLFEKQKVLRTKKGTFYKYL